MFEFYFLLFFIFIVCPIGLGLIIYRYWSKKIASSFAIVYGLIGLFAGGFLLFEDQLFTKNDALEILQAQNMTLYDQFELVYHQKQSSLNDAFQTFELKISETDKNKLIHQIKSAANFKPLEDAKIEFSSGNKERINHYETKDAYIRQTNVPHSISYKNLIIKKNENKLIFENFEQ